VTNAPEFASVLINTRENWQMRVSAALVALALIGIMATATEANAQRSNKSKSAASPIATPAPTPTPEPVPPERTFYGDELRPRSASLSWDAFIDVKASAPGKRAFGADRGVTLNDAAIYLTRATSAGLVHVDLPFFSRLDNPATIGSQPNAFRFAERKAQAFVEVRLEEFALRLGQYDTFFGFEAMDSRDRLFADAGILRANLLPRTHSGFQVAYRLEQIKIIGQIANPNGAGRIQEKENPEFGLHVRYRGLTGFGAVGFTMNETSEFVQNRTNMILDFVGGTQLDRFGLEGEFLLKKSQEESKTGTAIGLMGVYAHTPELSIGARFEMAKDIEVKDLERHLTGGALGGFAETINHFAIGPSYLLAPDFVLRVDVTRTSLRLQNWSEEQSIFGLSVSLVANL
jgi:hypothetical protein